MQNGEDEEVQETQEDEQPRETVEEDGGQGGAWW